MSLLIIILFRRNQQVSLVLPIPQGCHTISFFTGAEVPTSLLASNNLFCLPSQTYVQRGILSNFCFFFAFSTNPPSPPDVSNAGLFRNSAEGETMVLAACFDEPVTYLICSIRIYRDEPIHFSYSTIAPVCFLFRAPPSFPS